MFLPQRFCYFLGPIQEAFKSAEEGISDSAEGMLLQRTIDEARLFHEMETKGHLKDLQHEVVTMQSRGALQHLRARVLGQRPDRLATEVVDFLQQDKIDDAEKRVREAMQRDPKRTKEVIEKYETNPEHILARLRSGEITKDDARMLLQKSFLSHPFVKRAAEETKFDIEALAAGAAGIYIDTGKIPDNSWDLIRGSLSGAEGLFNFRVTKRAAEKMGVEGGSIRAVYNINVYKFSDIYKSLTEGIDTGLFAGTLSEENKNKLEERKKNPDIDSDERRIINYVIKKPDNAVHLRKIYEYVTNKENIDFSLNEIDKTFQKQAHGQGLSPSGQVIRKQSEEFFRDHLNIGRMLTLRFSVKEDRETLASYSIASIFGTLPRALRGNLRLTALSSLFKDPESLKHLNKALNNSFFRRPNILRHHLAAQELRLKGVTTQSAMQMGAISEESSKLAKRARGIGRVLRWAGPGMLAASEVYNLSTGRSTMLESAGRFAGGMLRFVPIVGTGLDFAEAITGKDQINGQVLTSTERIARVGWGVLGALGDVAMLIPGAGIFVRGGISAARAARIGRAVRTVRMGALAVGVGAGVAVPLVGTSAGREALATTGKIGYKGATTTLAAFRLMAGPGGGAADQMIAMEQFKEKVGDVTSSVAESTKGAFRWANNKAKGVYEKHQERIKDWDPRARERFMTYLDKSDKIDQLQRLVDNDPQKLREFQNICSETLSTSEIHDRMSEFIERASRGRER